MINFPVFQELVIDGYGLYPGTPDEQGLKIEFLPGLTLVIGANGLGKTTLITILYRLLTGPFDIPGLTSGDELGNRRLQPTKLNSRDRAIFGQRVTDGARTASATVTLMLGDIEIVIGRCLDTLGLSFFSVGGIEFAPEESFFQEHIAQLVGVSSFGDWILLLRHLVFYLEDRKALVWDPSAQKQVLRCLFLSAEMAAQWTERERAILMLDSRVRNLQAVVNKEEKEASEYSSSETVSVDHILVEIQSLRALQEAALEKRTSLADEVTAVDGQRAPARLRKLTAEQEREGRLRALEHAKLAAIGAFFPTGSDTARYVLSQLLTEFDCLVCGNRAVDTAKNLEERIQHHQCVICGHDTKHEDEAQRVSAGHVADRRLKKARLELQSIEPELKEAHRQLHELNSRYHRLVSEFASLEVEIAERGQRLESLFRSLPPGKATEPRPTSDLSVLRGRLARGKAEVAEKRKDFKAFLAARSEEMMSRSQEVKLEFEKYAKEFLFEGCELKWAPHRSALGQAGEQMEFPSFDLHMTGSDFGNGVIRSGPEQVSESQREFIDLAFRIGLMRVGGSKGCSLVIDAPESSLDAIFVKKAAAVLSGYAAPQEGNRLFIASNLVEGSLLPELIARCADAESKEKRIINLFKIAAPTAAVRIFKDEYERLLAALFETASNAGR